MYLSRDRLSARHSGSRGTLSDQPRPGERGEHVQGAVRVLEMLEHLAAEDQLGGIPLWLELLHRLHLVVDLGAGGGRPPACLADHLGERVRPPHPEAPRRQPQRQLALTASDFMGLAGAGSLDQLLELGEEAAHQAALDRVHRRVLVVDVAAALAGPLSCLREAHRPTGPSVSTRNRSPPARTAPGS